jgi:hypothetical protein
MNEKANPLGMNEKVTTGTPDFRPPGFKTSKLQDFKTSRLQDIKASKP